MQLNSFRKGGAIVQEEDVKAEKGAYFICTDLKLKPKAEQEWMMVANVNQSMVNVAEISDMIVSVKELKEVVQEDIELGSKNLLELNAASDGMQLTLIN